MKLAASNEQAYTDNEIVDKINRLRVKRLKKLERKCTSNCKKTWLGAGGIVFFVSAVCTVLINNMDKTYEELSSISENELSDFIQKTGSIITRENGEFHLANGDLECYSKDVDLNPFKVGSNGLYFFGNGYSNLIGDCNQKFNQILNIGNTDINNDSVAEGYSTDITKDKI